MAVYEPGNSDRVPELLLLHALRQSGGIGSALIDALVVVLRTFRLHAIRCGAVDETRLRKPTIPLVGFNDIELHDEIDLLLRF